MKYGEHLKANIAPEYGAAAYLNYSELDDIIQMLAEISPSGWVQCMQHSSVANNMEQRVSSAILYIFVC